MDDTEPVFTDVDVLEISLRPAADAGDEGIAVDVRFWGELPYEMGVPPEIVRVCEREGRGTVLEPILCKAEGDGDTGLGGELGSAIIWQRSNRGLMLEGPAKEYWGAFRISLAVLTYSSAALSSESALFSVKRGLESQSISAWVDWVVNLAGDALDMCLGRPGVSGNKPEAVFSVYGSAD